MHPRALRAVVCVDRRYGAPRKPLAAALLGSRGPSEHGDSWKAAGDVPCSHRACRVPRPSYHALPAAHPPRRPCPGRCQRHCRIAWRLRCPLHTVFRSSTDVSVGPANDPERGTLVAALPVGGGGGHPGACARVPARHRVRICRTAVLPCEPSGEWSMTTPVDHGEKFAMEIADPVRGRGLGVGCVPSLSNHCTLHTSAFRIERCDLQ
mmetsp:Transcript_54711/g.133789  ORF Transcript_54711/g.133789 Transcript_54711/m.133789 type:complete len:208 (-) Transcript_54711:112-735(-)